MYTIDNFSNWLRSLSPMNLNFTFFTKEPVSVLTETFAKNTCKMGTETKGDKRRRKELAPSRKEPGSILCLLSSPLVKIVKISKLEEIKHNQLNFEGNFEPPYLWTVNSF